MPLSDLMPSKPLPFIPRAACTLLGAVITQAGITAFVSPAAFSQQFGLIEQEPVNAWTYAFAARELSLGLILLTFAARRQWQEVGVVGAIMSICGLTDGIIDGRFGKGWKHAWQLHLAATAIFAPAPWYLLAH